MNKPLSEYYKHSAMGDGHLGKCKDCTKSDASKRIEKFKDDPIWIESEKLRGRLKYQKYQYKSKVNLKKHNDHIKKYPEKRLATTASQRIAVKDDCHRHHWSYNKEHWKDIFELEKKTHAFIHRYMEYDQEQMMYRVSSKFTDWDFGELLDTRERHELFIESCLTQKEF